MIEDPGQTVIESLYARRQALRPLYDFDLMMDAGHIRGWAIEDANADSLLRALNAITALSQAPAFLVGDGNHALAAAKQCWGKRARRIAAEDARRSSDALCAGRTGKCRESRD